MAIASVFRVAASSTNSTSVTSGAVNTTGATFILLGVSASAAVTITDSFGNTYALVGNASNGAYLYSCVKPIVGAGHTFTATTTSVTASGYPSISIVGFTGVGAFYGVNVGVKASIYGSFTDFYNMSVPTASDKCLCVNFDGFWDTDYDGALIGATSFSTSTSGYTVVSSPFAATKSTGVALAYGLFPSGSTGSTINVVWNLSPYTGYNGYRISAIWYPSSAGYLSIGAIQPRSTASTSLSGLSIGAIQPPPAIVAPNTTATLAVTLDNVSLVGTATSTAPIPSTGTLSVALASVTNTATATAAAPTPTSGGLTITLASLTTTATATAAVPTPTSGGLTVTLASLRVSATATYTPPTPSSGSLSLSLAGATVTGSGLYTPPPPTTASLALTLASMATTATVTVINYGSGPTLGYQSTSAVTGPRPTWASAVLVTANPAQASGKLTTSDPRYAQGDPL